MNAQYEVQMTDVPNDLYLFSAWKEGYLKQASLQGTTLDLEEINENLRRGFGSEVSKVSCALLPEILDEYIILPVGATLTKFCSPKLVSRKEIDSSRLSNYPLTIPGRNTTAYFLVQKLLPGFKQIRESNHGKILDSFQDESEGLTLMIHSTKSLEEQYGLKEVVNLYDLWREKSGQELLPLGCLVAKRSLGTERLRELTKCLSTSLSYADNNQSQIVELIVERTRASNKEAVLQGLNAWVNDDTRSLSAEGKKALFSLLEMSDPSLLKKWSLEDLIFNPNESN